MSRSSHLPPRYPFQRKAAIHPTNEPNKRNCNPSYKSVTLEDQPKWLDELLSDSDSSLRGKSDCMYGPNSPRGKCNVVFSDESCQNYGISDFGSKGDCYELNGESNTGKRHAGQRSRARKLQYIAELEETVNSFEALKSEMATKCSTLVQERVVLCMENSKLKQNMARLQEQKLIVEDEYQILRNEAERLKLGLASSLGRKKLHTYVGSNDIDSTEMCCQKLNWNKLHL